MGVVKTPVFGMTISQKIALLLIEGQKSQNASIGATSLGTLNMIRTKYGNGWKNGKQYNGPDNLPAVKGKTLLKVRFARKPQNSNSTPL